MGKYLGNFTIGSAGKDSCLCDSLLQGISVITTKGSSLSKCPVPCVDQRSTVVRSLVCCLVEIAIGALKFGSEVTERQRVFGVESMVIVQAIWQTSVSRPSKISGRGLDKP